MLEYDYEKRFNTAQCLEHPWIVKHRKIDDSESNNTSYVKYVMKNLTTLHSREQLQQATIAYITYSYCSSKEVECLQNLFSSLDANEDGQITLTEFCDGINKYYDKDNLPDKKSLEEIFQEME